MSRDIYLSTLTLTQLSERIEDARCWKECASVANVSPEYWERQAKAARAEMQYRRTGRYAATNSL